MYRIYMVWTMCTEGEMRYEPACKLWLAYLGKKEWINMYGYRFLVSKWRGRYYVLKIVV